MVVSVVDASAAALVRFSVVLVSSNVVVLVDTDGTVCVGMLLSDEGIADVSLQVTLPSFMLISHPVLVVPESVLVGSIVVSTTVKLSVVTRFHSRVVLIT